MEIVTVQTQCHLLKPDVAGYVICFPFRAPYASRALLLFFIDIIKCCAYYADQYYSYNDISNYTTHDILQLQSLVKNILTSMTVFSPLRLMRLLLEHKFHHYRIMIRIGKAIVYVVQLNHADIIGYKKAVDNKHLTVRAVRHITVSAGGNRILIVIL